MRKNKPIPLMNTNEKILHQSLSKPNPSYISRVTQNDQISLIPECNTGATSEKQWNFGFYSRANNKDYKYTLSWNNWK
jgi:hypothetical protein